MPKHVYTNLSFNDYASPGSRTRISRTGILGAIHYTSDAFRVLNSTIYYISGVKRKFQV